MEESEIEVHDVDGETNCSEIVSGSNEDTEKTSVATLDANVLLPLMAVVAIDGERDATSRDNDYSPPGIPSCVAEDHHLRGNAVAMANGRSHVQIDLEHKLVSTGRNDSIINDSSATCKDGDSQDGPRDHSILPHNSSVLSWRAHRSW